MMMTPRQSNSSPSALVAVQCPELDAAYLVPITDIPARQLAALRLERPRNGQTDGIRWAQPYALTTTNRPTARTKERKTGFEPATPYLASRCATAAPLPLDEPRGYQMSRPHGATNTRTQGRSGRTTAFFEGKDVRYRCATSA